MASDLAEDLAQRCHITEHANDNQLDVRFPNLALYLDEVKYVMFDLLRHWTDFVLYAASDAPDLVTIRPWHDKDKDGAVLTAIKDMKERAFRVSCKKCPQMVVIEAPDEFQCKLLHSVSRLRFLCKGRVTVFPYPALTDKLRFSLRASKLNATDMFPVVAPYYDYIAKIEPQWMINTKCGPKFCRCAIVVMIYSDPEHDFVWHLWVEENKEWAFAGGDVNRIADRNLLGTAEREWNEEVLGFPFCEARDTSVEPLVLPFIAGDSARYPVQPYVYCKASTSFFEATRAARFPLNVPAGKVAVTKGSSNKELAKLHMDPNTFFLEHEWGSWAKRASNGQLEIEQLALGKEGPQSTKVRWENMEGLQVHWGLIEERILARRPKFETKSSKSDNPKGKGKGSTRLLQSTGCTESIGKWTNTPKDKSGTKGEVCREIKGKAKGLSSTSRAKSDENWRT